VQPDLPSGTVTFVFTDVVGSTRLLHELGADTYAEALAEHRRLLRAAFRAHSGIEVDTQGDAFFYAFPTGPKAVDAARQGQEALSPGPIRVRIGVHTGTPHVTEEGYVGPDVHKGARIAAAGHGGQVLLSKETCEAGDTDVLDLGEHRLKDFAEPVWIFQLGRERFPPLKTISNTNLPHPASSFVGREQELKEVISLLRGDVRLLTLTGPGGSGKTRLAIEAAAELVPDFRNGVFWIGLATLRDPALVSEEIAHTLGATDALDDYIGEREMLLLLDNFEQVVDAAWELSSLLSACPGLRMVVTSRELLRIGGEVEYAVPPLAQPEAVELFCNRSGLKPDAKIAELCVRLDDLPLAVELAAARTSVLSPAQILERIGKRLDLFKGGRDSTPRQATLRATIEWSHDLLSAEEKKLFARLAVFRGGCTLDAAEEVTDAELDILQSLVDKSLVRHTQDRFWMLEMIGDHAGEQLEKHDDAAKLRQRHAERFLALAEEAEPHVLAASWLGGSAGEWIALLEREHANLRAALDWLEASDESQMTLRVAGALSEFWDLRGYYAEGLRRLESALRSDERPTATRAKALRGAAEIALSVGDTQALRRLAEDALSLHLELGDAWGAAFSRFILSNAAADQGDLTTSEHLADESLRVFREVGDEHMALWASRHLAWTYDNLGDPERAHAVHEDNLRQARALHNQEVEWQTLGSLASYIASKGRVQDAASMLKAALHICRELGDLPIAVILCRIAGAFALAGKAHAATQLLAGAEALHEEIGASVRPRLADMNEETLATIRTQLDEESLASAWEQGRMLRGDEVVALALDQLG
jgi:predicted ATPase